MPIDFAKDIAKLYAYVIAHASFSNLGVGLGFAATPNELLLSRKPLANPEGYADAEDWKENRERVGKGQDGTMDQQVASWTGRPAGCRQCSPA